MPSSCRCCGPVLRERSGQLGLRRDMIFPGGEAPEADKGIDCRVKGSARARGAIQRLLQEVCGLRLQLRRAVPVQAGDVAVLCRGGKQGFERTERVLRLRDKGFLAPDAQTHQRVHGKKLCLVRLRLLWAAARQGQCCQKYGSEPFFQGDHLIFRDHYIKKEKFSQIVFDIFLPGWYDKQAASKRYKLEVCPHAFQSETTIKVGANKFMQAVIVTGGKQYSVKEGDVIYVEKLNAEADATVTFDQVLAVRGRRELQVRRSRGGRRFCRG